MNRFKGQGSSEIVEKCCARLKFGHVQISEQFVDDVCGLGPLDAFVLLRFSSTNPLLLLVLLDEGQRHFVQTIQTNRPV